MNFNVQGRIDPADPAADYLPDDPGHAREREELFRKWETVGLTPAEKVRFEELTGRPQQG